MALVTLLTDFGTADYYVAAVKGTLLRLAPGVEIVDLSHEIPAGDVEAAADLLAGAAPTFPAGTVHLAVVDPGVGSARRILVVEARAQRFVAPDNGLLTPFLDAAVAANRVWAVERSELFLEGPGSTFHGRDRFAPVAAAIARSARVVHSGAGVGTGELGRMGPVVDDPIRLDVPPPRREEAEEGTLLLGRVARVDRYGNLVTDLPADWLGGSPSGAESAPRVEVGDHVTARWVDHYAELPAGEPGALVGSRGTVELSLRDDDLAARWGVRRAAPVRIVLR